MRVLRFAIGMSVVAVSAIASAVAHSPAAERTQVIRQTALTKPHSLSETEFQLSDRQRLKDHFLLDRATTR